MGTGRNLFRRNEGERERAKGKREKREKLARLEAKRGIYSYYVFAGVGGIKEKKGLFNLCTPFRDKGGE